VDARHKAGHDEERKPNIMSVRIVDVRVAVITERLRDGKRVVGYGFNSNGRYGQGGLIRERFAPRLLEADPNLAR
jgi:D(-)-tartrate dehydratase